MNVTGLSFTHFRNFEGMREVQFPDGKLFVLASPNATGKTNFLEGLMMLLRGKSWRGGATECVQWGKDHFVVTGRVQTERGEAELQVGYDAAAKMLRVQEDGAPVSLVTLYSRYPVIVFLPDDTFMFGRGPEMRRNFLNSVLVSVPAYLAALVQYHRALKQRNSALKTARQFQDVASWTHILIDYATILHQQRERLVSFFMTHVAPLYTDFSGEAYEFTLRLATHGTPQDLLTRFEEGFSEERAVGHTLWGPHRDDLVVRVNDHLVNRGLSQGQTRTLVIALKIAAHRFLEHVGGERPLVLLDEVLSELDEQRQEAFLTHLPQSQLVMTCTKLPKVLRGRDAVHVLDVRNL